MFYYKGDISKQAFKSLKLWEKTILVILLSFDIIIFLITESYYSKRCWLFFRLNILNFIAFLSWSGSKRSGSAGWYVTDPKPASKIQREKNVALVVVGRAITLREANRRRPWTNIQNLCIQIWSREIKSDNSCYRKVAREMLSWGAIEKRSIFLSQ